jgi:F0F1-type ATP synthase epsilon subunit
MKTNSNEVILPTLTGQMGVLKDHMPLLTGLDTGWNKDFLYNILDKITN